MRVIAGMHRGRRLVAPKGESTRPTTDRVREALFSSIASHLGPGLSAGTVLDAFAGSGALGIEALSRGASFATFVEKAPSALSALERNLADLRVSAQARIVRGDVFSLAKRGVGRGYALIMLDPPYTLDAAVVAELLASLLASGAAVEGTIVSWEHSAATDVSWPEGFVSLTTKKYGSIGVDLGRCVKGEDGS